jgi:hypothetical protein
MINQQQIQKLLTNHTYYHLFKVDNCCMVRNPSNDKEIYIYKTNDLDFIFKQDNPYYKPVKRKNCILFLIKLFSLAKNFYT